MTDQLLQHLLHAAGFILGVHTIQLVSDLADMIRRHRRKGKKKIN